MAAKKNMFFHSAFSLLMVFSFIGRSTFGDDLRLEQALKTGANVWKLREALKSGASIKVNVFVWGKNYSQSLSPDLSPAFEPVAKIIIDGLKKTIPDAKLSMLTPEERSSITNIPFRSYRRRHFDYPKLKSAMVLEVNISRASSTKVEKSATGAKTFRVYLGLFLKLHLFDARERKQIWAKGGMTSSFSGGTMFREGFLSSIPKSKLDPINYVSELSDMTRKEMDKFLKIIGYDPVTASIKEVTNPKKKMVVLDKGSGQDVKKKMGFWIVKKIAGDDSTTPWIEHFVAIGELQVKKTSTDTSEAQVKKLKGPSVNDITGMTLIEITKSNKKRWKL